MGGCQEEVTWVSSGPHIDKEDMAGHIEGIASFLGEGSLAESSCLRYIRNGSDVLLGPRIAGLRTVGLPEAGREPWPPLWAEGHGMAGQLSEYVMDMNSRLSFSGSL